MAYESMEIVVSPALLSFPLNLDTKEVEDKQKRERFMRLWKDSHEKLLDGHTDYYCPEK